MEIKIIFLISILILACGCVENTNVEQKQSKKFSKLEITDIVYEDGKVKVTGTTDLPNGSQLNVN
ncbi:MAG: hypothetical protein ACXQTL_04260, partial [Methanosarcinales archaeon]